jgi:hypothetical protein
MPEIKSGDVIVAKKRKPNFLIVLIDDLRFDELGICGHPYMKTPNIDRVGHEGAMFTSAFHTTPLCSPNRASILSGQYASRHGIIDNVARDAMSHRLPNYHLELQRLGYETAHIGKWHMGNDGKSTKQPTTSGVFARESDMSHYVSFRSFVTAMGLLVFAAPLQAELSAIDIRSRTLLSEPDNPVRYELISGVLHFTLDPLHPGNQKIVDIQHAPLNTRGRTEFSADFKLLVPRGETQSTSLLYHVNNRGGSRLPPEMSLSHPLALQGHTFLATGWINEMPPADGRLRLIAPVLTHDGEPLTGRVRYEIIPSSHGNDLNIAGSFHLKQVQAKIRRLTF